MNAYTAAKERYAALGVDTETALARLNAIPVSLHCWQGDDVRGFEDIVTAGGGIQSTGNHPGGAGNLEELCAMLDKALTLIPGTHKINLHAIYGDLDGVERNAIEPRHFSGWVDWAKDKHMGLDFNPTLFAHPKAADGLTLSHPYESVREYWIEHCRRCRKIGAYFGESLGQPSIVNLWIEDGFKDVPADTLSPRLRLKNALDRIYGDAYPPDVLIDSVESKLFGIGLESYTAGSYEFYLGYAMEKRLALCLDTGHFHPTEMVSAKLTALYPFLERILLHVSRPVRWDSDHVVLLDDELCAITKELVRHNLLDRIHLGLDFFDGSIDRIAAWAIGARNLRKALIIALLEPWTHLKEAEQRFDFTRRLMLNEEFKCLPWTAVWDEYCTRQNCPPTLNTGI